MGKYPDSFHFKLSSYQGNLVWSTLELSGFGLYRTSLAVEYFFLFQKVNYKLKENEGDGNGGYS